MSLVSELRDLADNPPIDRRPYPGQELRSAADRIEALEAALEPFAKKAANYGHLTSDDTPNVHVNIVTSIGQLRAAHSAMTQGAAK